ncbi:MAG TPA: ACP S-malonyltransferase [Gemmatimonadota bacterium]|nr:ACP S-malonyltransferase [Gemmatimonadota bacterium]
MVADRSGVAFQFPGQGSQVVGMGAALADAYPEARAAFREADEILGFAISTICWEGPGERLRATENAQPALLAHSVAVVRVLSGRGVRPDWAAGHSLGEFSAHVAAGSVTFDDALRLVRARGEAMAEAGRSSPGSMAAVLGLDDVAVAALCRAVRREGEVLEPANFNAPGQIVISGTRQAIRRAVDEARDHGARKAVELPVSGAFHSPLMAPAAARLAEALSGVELREARIPVVANVDAAPVTDPEAIRSRLLEQLTAPVRWTDCVKRLRELGAIRFVEPGPGAVLTGLLKRIDRELGGQAVGGPEEVETLAAA